MNCTGLSGISLPTSLVYIYDQAFAGCTGLKGTLTLPDSVGSIGIQAFSGCTGLTGILKIPKSVSSLQNEAFMGCTGLSGNLVIPDLTTRIYPGTFKNCSGLTSISLPSMLEFIGEEAFSGCTGLNGSLILPSLDYNGIGKNAFNNCSGLTSLSFTNSTMNLAIYDYAFSGCTGLKSIYVYSAIPSPYLGTDVFLNVPKNSCVLYVPIGSKSAYQAADQWKDFTNIVEFSPAAVPTVIGDNIKLFPNPTIDKFQITGVEGKATLKLTDINGRLLFAKSVVNKENVSLTSLPKGQYIVEITTTEGTLKRKILKK